MAHTPLSGFTGSRLDPNTAAYPLGKGYRWFLPALARFNAADDLSPFGLGGINPYAYCADDPVNHSDPSGHIGIWEDIIVTSFEDAAQRQRESRLPDAGSYLEAKQQYADDLAKYMHQSMAAQEALAASAGLAPAPPSPFAFDARHEPRKFESLGPANTQATAAGPATAGSPAAASPDPGPSAPRRRPRGPRRVGTQGQASMQDAHSHFATRIAKAIPRQDLTFARILEHVSATPFYRLGLATRARQTMDRFIGVLEFHGVRASSLIDYEPGRIFRKFGFHWEEKPGLKLKSDIRQGHDVRANIRRLYWLGFEPDEWTG